MLKKLAACTVLLGLLSTACEKTTVEGPGNEKLTIVKPMDQSIERGSSDKVSVVVKRTKFEGPVTIEFTNLPNGVTVVDDDRRIEGNQRTFVLAAASDADLVSDSVVNVTATGPSGLSATEQFKITVKGK